MPNAKKYILTSVILGSIAAVAAGLIAVTNLITAGKIKQNEIDAVNKGINEIFANGVVTNEENVSGFTYVNYRYDVDYQIDNYKMHGHAFRCEGSNMYGKISLIAGFNEANNFMSLYLVKNEQTYATTLVDNYIKPLNQNKRDLEDVSCGATYGAKLVRDMVNDAKEAAKALWSK